MGWKGTLRSIQAAQRRAEREARRRQRELERQRKQLEKMQELERAAYEVEVYENYVELLQSVHKECSDVWDWKAIQSSEPPIRPIEACTHAEAAQAKLDRFRPGIFDKLMGHVESRRDELVRAVDEARHIDEKEYQEALRAYEQAYVDWEASRELAGRILAGNSEAYLDAIRQVDPFGDISELGSSIELRVRNSSLVEATLHVNSEEVIPSEVKGLLKSGALSVKHMPKGRFYQLHQDHVCSYVLRVARELFALLPINWAIVTAIGNILNTQTGFMEECPILSAAIPRTTLQGLNFEAIDPSDSMGNFVHRMKFKTTKGFDAVQTVKPSDLQMEDLELSSLAENEIAQGSPGLSQHEYMSGDLKINLARAEVQPDQADTSTVAPKPTDAQSQLSRAAEGQGNITAIPKIQKRTSLYGIAGGIAALVLICLTCLGFALLGNTATPEKPIATERALVRASATSELTNTLQPTNTPKPANTPTNTSMPTILPTFAVISTPIKEGIFATVSAEALNIRSGPGVSYEIIGQVYGGDQLVVIARGESGDWLKVLQDSQEGWVSVSYVQTTGKLDLLPVATALPPPTPTPFPTPTLAPTPTPANTQVPNVNEPSTHPAGATAICNDGTYSFSANRRGTCSRHGGVRQWLR